MCALISEERIFEIKKSAIDTLILCDVIMIPITAPGVAYQLLKDETKFIPYSSLLDDHNTNINDIIKKFNTKDGITIYKDKIYYVFFNDVTHHGREQFTLAHELAHIFLGHIFIMQSKALTPEEKKILEYEANIFAAEILAPTSILYLLEKINNGDLNWKQIHNVFHTSEQASKIILEVYKDSRCQDMQEYRFNELIEKLNLFIPKNVGLNGYKTYVMHNQMYQNLDKMHVSNIMKDKIFNKN